MKFQNMFATVKDIQQSNYDEEIQTGGLDADFGRHFNLKRLGIHYLILAPGQRSSRPHAESLEEEFIYVVSGEVDLWFNGRIKKMRSGNAIGFEPGTGIGHCFINNSNNDVALFIAGDRTFSENKYRYHLQDELEVTYKDSWWSDMPVQKLGGHNGAAGDYCESLIDDSIKTLHGASLIPNESYSYPGDDETFSFGVCLSRKFGLKRVAVWLEKLPPGKRSSWPHAHSEEEEFAFVLEGDISVWLDGEIVKTFGPTAIDFKAGSRIAHTLINETDRDIYYLCVGEGELEGDKIFYPLHPKQNDYKKSIGELWEF